MKCSRWIIAGTDFSPAADSAVDHAAELAAELGASIAVVHAYEDPPGAPFDGDPTIEVRARLDETACALKSRHPSLRVETLIRRGAPWEKLANVACELGAEMIVVGASGEGSRANPAFLGRVVSRVAVTSNRSVLVIPTLPAHWVNAVR